MPNQHSNSYRSSRSKNTNSPEQEVVETILKGLWFLVSLPFRKGKKVSKHAISREAAQELANHWPGIEMHLANPTTLALAVSEADKLFDAAMQAAQIDGTTMGERLKAATHMFPDNLYQDIWRAHKLRNTIAHEVGTMVSYEEAQSALNIFRTALVHLGVFV